ncbi:hypothetical protein [Streptomyces sp. A0592]|uniref:hypothetical protein n=1 Tax=Streptomyces sp. A0592 TaxID=2563099 RepID=UPI00109EAF5F|nr:hypothetical protein [Streptomyces sp. A0592]THA84847.1 hypothetical protein E6U81_10570 [Streptomyces sp. A0592]
MRTALRTSVVTVALAGATLVPAAGAAFAAPATTPRPASAPAPDNSRYEGEPVYIGEGLVAVLRNKAEGPEAWIREVGPQWKPGDTYMVHVVTKLDRTLPHDRAKGLDLELTKAAGARPVLVVTAADGSATSHPLPAGETGTDCRVGPVGQEMGAGMKAELYLSELGPKVLLFEAGDGGRGFARLDRTHPSLPESAGIIARIVHPSSAEPVFEWKTQGGNDTVGRVAFPAFPKGCRPSYAFTEDKPVTKRTTPSSASTPAPVKPQTAGQTAVVPKGPVAAGAELPVATAADTAGTAADTVGTAAGRVDTATMTAGAALVAAFGALGASVVLRRRRATRG